MEYVLQIIGLPQWKARNILAPVRALLCHVHDHFIPHPRNNYHPHILGHKALALFSTFLVSLKIFTLALVSFGPVIPAFSSAITPENIISLTNESRVAYSLGVLAENPLLTKAAQAKAEDMLAKGYFSHDTPDNRTPWSFIQKAGYNYLLAGENLAVNFTESEDVEQAWMNSPSHKANILNKNYEEIGIGIAQGEYQGHSAIFVVQMFGTPAEQKVTLTNTPTPVLAQSVPEPWQAAQKASVASALVKPDAVSAEIVISDAKVIPEGSMVRIVARISGGAVKAIVHFGQRAIMLDPKANDVWQGTVALSSLAQGSVSAKISAYDITGSSTQLQLADFSNNTIDNFNVLGATSGTKVKWLGKIFDPKVFEQKFYLLFVTGILVSLILAIGIHRHVQHLSLIANSSFVAILAIMIWLTG